MHLDHVAWLTPSLEASAERLGGLRLAMGGVEEFPGEGTRELYVGAPNAAARLLLMQPFGAEGPYARALRERGPGLHHVALRVGDLKDYVGGLAGSGWYLLPQSLATIERSGTAWLARPGFSLLVEAMAGASEADDSDACVIEAVEIAAGAAGVGAASDLLARLAPRGRRLVGLSAGDETRLKISGRWITP